MGVFGLPDARLGEVVGCAVYPQPGQDLTAEEVNKHAAAMLAKFKVPNTEHIFMRQGSFPRERPERSTRRGCARSMPPTCRSRSRATLSSDRVRLHASVIGHFCRFLAAIQSGSF